MTKKTLPALAMASSMAMLGLLPATVFAASTSSMVMLSSSATTVNVGQTVTYQVSDSAATRSTEYQFWVQSPSGQWRVGQNYSFSNSFTVHATQAGSETVVAYALSQTAVLAHDWGQALATNPDPLYAGSQVSLTVSPIASSDNPIAHVTVTAKNVMSPLYQLWWKTPAGVWEQSGGYQASSLFTVALPEAGNYQFVAYAKAPDAMPTAAEAVYTPGQMVAVTVPAARVVVTPAVSALKAGSQGVDPLMVAVEDAAGNPIMNFNGTVTVMDTEGLLIGNNSTSNTVSVAISHGIGMAQVMAAATSGVSDTITAGSLTANAGNLVQPTVNYGSTTVTSRSFSGNISQLNSITQIASTVSASNGDQNPYGLTYYNPPNGPATDPFIGDFLVSNFSNSGGTNGAGSAIVAVNPNTGAVTPFASTAAGPVNLAVSPLGPVWVANFGTQGTNGNDQVLTPIGGEFPQGGSIITSPFLDGPWGQAFVPSAAGPAFFVSNALSGTIDAMYGFSPPSFNTDTKFTVIGQRLAHQGTTAASVQGPQGMIYDASTHLVYVTDTADNSIRAYYWNGPNTPNQGMGQLIYQGAPLKAPVGITIDPLNGDLLVANQGNNNLVEIALNDGHAYVAGQKVLDNTPVNPQTGAGSALFGVYALVNNGQLEVFFTDDNTNTLDVLK